MSVEVFYDGECPFCARYTRLMRLRQNVGPVDLIDARSDDPRAVALRQSGLDLDRGMAVNYGGRLYHGADAAHILAVLSDKGGVLNAILRSPRRAALFYPIMRAVRNLSLQVLGRRKIGGQGRR